MPDQTGKEEDLLLNYILRLREYFEINVFNSYCYIQRLFVNITGSFLHGCHNSVLGSQGTIKTGWCFINQHD